MCNPATLKLRLDRLEELGVLERSVRSYMPPRTSYRLARAREYLQRVIMAFDGWGSGADRGLLELVQRVTPLLALPLVLCAVLSQFSAATADTEAGVGNRSP